MINVQNKSLLLTFQFLTLPNVSEAHLVVANGSVH